MMFATGANVSREALPGFFSGWMVRGEDGEELGENTCL